MGHRLGTARVGLFPAHRKIFDRSDVLRDRLLWLGRRLWLLILCRSIEQIGAEHNQCQEHDPRDDAELLPQ